MRERLGETREKSEVVRARVKISFNAIEAIRLSSSCFLCGTMSGIKSVHVAPNLHGEQLPPELKEDGNGEEEKAR